MLVDRRRAGLFAVRAAMAYFDIDMPFGALLAIGLIDDELLRSPRGKSRIVQPVQAMIGNPPMQDPVQRLYLLLIVAARPWLWTGLRRPIESLQEDLNAHQLHPVGAQGTPLTSYLDLAAAMLPTDRPEPELQSTSRYETPTDRMIGNLAAAGRRRIASHRPRHRRCSRRSRDS